jgi:hypothetical protein
MGCRDRHILRGSRSSIQRFHIGMAAEAEFRYNLRENLTLDCESAYLGQMAIRNAAQLEWGTATSSV